MTEHNREFLLFVYVFFFFQFLIKNIHTKICAFILPENLSPFEIIKTITSIYNFDNNNLILYWKTTI